MLLAAVGALEIAHVLDYAEHGDVHELCHVDGLCNDHGNKLLGRGDDNDAVNGQRLENRQRNVACSGRHIDKHVVNIVPQHVAPELSNNAGDNGTAPNDGVGLVVENKVNGHDLRALV